MRKAKSESNAINLRQQAEELLKKKSIEDRGNLSEIETLKLIHELEVHQIELELLNDELYHAQAMAEVASDKYSKLYDFSPTGYLSLSKEGSITVLNLIAAKMLGKERSHIQGAQFGFFVSDDTRPAFNQFLDDIFSRNAQETCELTLKPKSDSTVFIHLTGIAANNGEDCLVSLIDITERKQAETALRESEEKFKAVFEIETDGIFLLTSDGAIIAVNEAFARMHGFTVDELMTKNIKDLDTPESSRHAPQRIQKVMAGESMIFEVEHYHKSGHTIPIEVTANLVTIGGNEYLLCFHRDITERKLAEGKIKQQKEQLARLNAEKDKFFSIIAHDLRSPLNGLLGLTQHLVAEMPTMDKDQTQKVAVMMRQSATKLYNLLENLFEWSLIQRGMISFKPESFTLVKGIVPIIDLVRDAADKKMIRIGYDIPENLEVTADAHMFTSLMNNLIFNAVKFTPKGRDISIDAKPIPDGWVEISVKDSGIGMNKDVLDNLLHLEEPINRTGTEGEPSSGLGLIICKDFVEKHGGRLWVESEEGKGSTFYFTLPSLNL